MTILTTKDTRIAYATEESYGKLCSIIGTIDQTGVNIGDTSAHTFTVTYNGTIYTVTGSHCTDTAATVVVGLTASFGAATMSVAGSEPLANIISAEASGNFILLRMKSGCVLTDVTDTPLVSHFGIPAGNYPNRAFAGNSIITTADCSGGIAIDTKTMTVDGVTVTFDSSPGNQAAMVIELNDAFVAAGVNTKIVASASGTQYIALAITENVSINAVAASTSLVLLGITAGFYGFWTTVNVPNSTKLGFIEIERKREHMAGQTANNTFLYAIGKKYKDFELVLYCQTVTWMTLVIATGAGSTPSSFTFHVEIPAKNSALEYADIMGCVVSKYSLEGKKDDCLQTITFLYQDTAYTAAYTSIPVYPFSTAPMIFPNVYLSVDGDVLSSSLDSFTLEVTNECWDFTGAGSYLRSVPQIMFRDVDLKIEGYEDLANQIALLNTLAPTNVSIIAGFGAAFRMQITNMLPETSNEGDIPNKLDNFKHTYNLKNGGDCVYSIV